MGQQFIQPRDANQDYWFPIFASLQFIFYVGWLKVAETLINPFGEDDDDFDTCYMVDRNIQFAFLLIDQVRVYFYSFSFFNNSGSGWKTSTRDGEGQVVGWQCAQGAALHHLCPALQTWDRHGPDWQGGWGPSVPGATTSPWPGLSQEAVQPLPSLPPLLPLCVSLNILQHQRSHVWQEALHCRLCLVNRSRFQWSPHSSISQPCSCRWHKYW